MNNSQKLAKMLQDLEIDLKTSSGEYFYQDYKYPSELGDNCGITLSISINANSVSVNLSHSVMMIVQPIKEEIAGLNEAELKTLAQKIHTVVMELHTRTLALMSPIEI